VHVDERHGDSDATLVHLASAVALENPETREMLIAGLKHESPQHHRATVRPNPSVT
jgi:hypothetical protein